MKKENSGAFLLLAKKRRCCCCAIAASARLAADWNLNVKQGMVFPVLERRPSKEPGRRIAAESILCNAEKHRASFPAKDKMHERFKNSVAAQGNAN